MSEKSCTQSSHILTSFFVSLYYISSIFIANLRFLLTKAQEPHHDNNFLPPFKVPTSPSIRPHQQQQQQRQQINIIERSSTMPSDNGQEHLLRQYNMNRSSEMRNGSNNNSTNSRNNGQNQGKLCLPSFRTAGYELEQMKSKQQQLQPVLIDDLHEEKKASGDGGTDNTAISALLNSVVDEDDYDMVFATATTSHVSPTACDVDGTGGNDYADHNEDEDEDDDDDDILNFKPFD
jgi:hypothetical protein